MGEWSLANAEVQLRDAPLHFLWDLTPCSFWSCGAAPGFPPRHAHPPLTLPLCSSADQQPKSFVPSLIGQLRQSTPHVLARAPHIMRLRVARSSHALFLNNFVVGCRRRPQGPAAGKNSPPSPCEGRRRLPCGSSVATVRSPRWRSGPWLGARVLRRCRPRAIPWLNRQKAS